MTKNTNTEQEVKNQLIKKYKQLCFEHNIVPGTDSFLGQLEYLVDQAIDDLLSAITQLEKDSS